MLSQHALQQGGLLGGACSGGSAPGGCGDPLLKQTATVVDGTHPTGMHSCLSGILRHLLSEMTKLAIVAKPLKTET